MSGKGFRVNEVAIIVAICLVAFLPVFDAGFVNWDDPLYVTENENIRDFSLNGIAQLFHPENRVTDTYTPLTLLSFAIEYQLAGPTPLVFHLTNLLLHILNVLLVFQLVKWLGFKNNIALFVAVGLSLIHI